MQIPKSRFVKTSREVLCFTSMFVFFFASMTFEISHASEMIRVEGASESQLLRVQAALEKAAYGSTTSPTKKPTVATDDDTCEFYKPPQKLRLFKRMPSQDPCRDETSTTIIADTQIAVIFLCKDKKTVADFDFSLGRNGTGKRIEGDRKTPIGSYAITAPVASDKFSIFIPIGFPTIEQTKAGYSGSDVGIHGPSRTFRCAGFLNTVVNWTQGCLAVASDLYVKEIGRFVETNGVRSIKIL